MAYFITEACIGCGACKRGCPVFAVVGGAKERHAINPDRCVECGVCGRVCPKGAVADAMGRPCSRVPKNEWPKPLIDTEICSACGICVDACAAGALEISSPAFRGDIDVFAEVAHPEKCVACGLCAARCPLGAVLLAPVEVSV